MPDTFKQKRTQFGYVVEAARLAVHDYNQGRIDKEGRALAYSNLLVATEELAEATRAELVLSIASLLVDLEGEDANT